MPKVSKEKKINAKIDDLVHELRVYINDNLPPSMGRRMALEGLKDCQGWCEAKLTTMERDRVDDENSQPSAQV